MFSVRGRSNTRTCSASRTFSVVHFKSSKISLLLENKGLKQRKDSHKWKWELDLTQMGSLREIPLSGSEIRYRPSLRKQRNSIGLWFYSLCFWPKGIFIQCLTLKFLQEFIIAGSSRELILTLPRMSPGTWLEFWPLLLILKVSKAELDAGNRTAVPKVMNLWNIIA